DDEETWNVSAPGRVGVEIKRRAGGAASTVYTYKDHLTGTSHVTDESGTILGFQEFGPYGEARARIGAPSLYGYAGALNEPVPAVGVVRFGNRYYSSGIGRWASADAALAESPKRLMDRQLEANLYGYASNNPLNLVDPGGAASDAPAQPAEAANGAKPSSPSF